MACLCTAKSQLAVLLCLSRYCEDKFIQKYIPTIGVDYGVKPVRLGDYEVRVFLVQHPPAVCGVFVAWPGAERWVGGGMQQAVRRGRVCKAGLQHSARTQGRDNACTCSHPSVLVSMPPGNQKGTAHTQQQKHH